MNVAFLILFIMLCTKVTKTLLDKAAKHLVSGVVRKTSESTRLRRDAEELKKKLSVVSAQGSTASRRLNDLFVDEFAYHARLQRELNKVTESLTNSTSNDQMFAWKARLVMKGIAMMFAFMAHVVVVWWFWNDVVASVPANFLYPIDGVLAYPSGKSGDVGAPAWVLLSSRALELIVSLLNHSHKQYFTSQVETES